MTRRSCFALCSFAAAAAFATLLSAQRTEALTFDVVSIKLNQQPPRERKVAFGCNGTRFVSTATGILGSLFWAFDLRDYQVLNRPQGGSPIYGPWDIEARAGFAITEDQCRQMVQHMLEDRFGLKYHYEQRTLPAYSLVVAPKGLKIHPVAEGDTSPNGGGFTVDGSPEVMEDPNLPGWTMDQLTVCLGIARLGRQIFNRTGLTGIYKINLRFRRSDPEGADPDVTTALETQLGLRLVPTTESIRSMVIDHIALPTPN